MRTGYLLASMVFGGIAGSCFGRALNIITEATSMTDIQANICGIYIMLVFINFMLGIASLNYAQKAK